MPPTPPQTGHTPPNTEQPRRPLLLTLPLHPPRTMTLDRRSWREALEEATRSYGELRCIGLYGLMLATGVGATAGVFIGTQWLLDRTQYALWAWGIGLLILLGGCLLVLGVLRLLLRGPRRHLALVLEIRGIVLCARCGYRIEGLRAGRPCPECAHVPRPARSPEAP